MPSLRPEAFADNTLFDDLYNESMFEYVRRLVGFATLPENAAAWLHKYSDEGPLRAKEIVWSGSDHTTSRAMILSQRFSALTVFGKANALLTCSLRSWRATPFSSERVEQAVEIVIHLVYHADGSGQIGGDRFPYSVISNRLTKDDLPVDREFVDWTVDTLAHAKPDWVEINIFGPLDNRRDPHTSRDQQGASLRLCPAVRLGR